MCITASVIAGYALRLTSVATRLKTTRSGVLCSEGCGYKQRVIIMKLRLQIAVVAALLLGTLSAYAANDTQPLYDDIGDYHYEVTTSDPLAQEYFDQGLRLYYAFNHSEAIRAFRVAQNLDASCAMCWWGEALAWGPNINLPMDTPSGEAAYAAITMAIGKKSSVNAREAALIDALGLRYAAVPPEDRSSLDKTYSDAMAELAQRYQDDLDIRVLYAESLMDLRPWNYWREDGSPQTGMDVALAYLEQVIARQEKHPGACHFYIHAVEEVYPERAVECAERLANLMPGAGHLVHMPGHIYIRVGRYLDAVAANEHAVHADETYIRDQHPGMGMYINGYYPHNYDFMAFAAMMIGRSELSIDSAKKLTSLFPAEMFGTPGMDFLQHWTVRPLLMQVRFAQWQEILETQRPPSEQPHALALWHYARGRAHAARGEIDQIDVHLQQLREIAARPELRNIKMEFNPSNELVAVAERVLTGWRHAAEQDYVAAVSALQTAVQLEEGLLYGEPPEWSVPASQDLGAVLLLAGKAAQAETVFRSDLRLFPQNGWSLYGLNKALRAQGKIAEAEEVTATLSRVWDTADVQLEEIF